MNLVRRVGRGRLRVPAVRDAADGGVKDGLRVGGIDLQGAGTPNQGFCSQPHGHHPTGRSQSKCSAALGKPLRSWRGACSSAQPALALLLAQWTLCSRRAPHHAIWERLRGAAGRAVLCAVLVVDLPVKDSHRSGCINMAMWSVLLQVGLVWPTTSAHRDAHVTHFCDITGT